MDDPYSVDDPYIFGGDQRSFGVSRHQKIKVLKSACKPGISRCLSIILDMWMFNMR